MRLGSPVRSIPSVRAAADMFQSTFLRTWRIRLRSASARISSRLGRAALPGGIRICQGRRFFCDPLGSGQDCHALDHIAQLAKVPRPSIASQQGPNPAFNPFGFEIVPVTEILQRVLRKRPETLNASAQRRHANRHGAGSIMQVLPEFFWSTKTPRPRLVADISRTATRRVSPPPTRWDSPSCRTRSRLA